MKILIIGFLVFCGWTALSTNIFVCKILGLCTEPEQIEISAVNMKDGFAKDTVPDLIDIEKARMPETLEIYFEFDKSELKPDPETDIYITEAQSFMNKDSMAAMTITGYTDAVGSDEYNQALGFRRAQNTREYFQKRGIPEIKITIESKGEKQPSDDNNTTAGRAKNRKTLIIIKK
jgi:outer membrane protein OmpA-like peptidoglycan-associated protein